MTPLYQPLAVVIVIFLKIQNILKRKAFFCELWSILLNDYVISKPLRNGLVITYYDSEFRCALKTQNKPLGSYYDHNSLVYPGLVPVFIKEIVQKLEENSHLETEGLYRVPADRKKRRELLEYFDSSYKIGGKIFWVEFLTSFDLAWHVASRNDGLFWTERWSSSTKHISRMYSMVHLFKKSPRTNYSSQFSKEASGRHG